MATKNHLHKITKRQTYILIRDKGELRKQIVQYHNFPDGDTHCVVENSQLVAGKSVLICQDLYPDQNEQIIRLVLLISLLKELHAKKVAVFTPYLPYARQDRRHIPNEAVSIDVICYMLLQMGCDLLYTIDCHFMKGEENVIRNGLPIKNSSAASLLIGKGQTIVGRKPLEIIGPDDGAKHLVKNFGAKNLHKNRGDYEEIAGGVTYRNISEMDGGHISLDSDTVMLLDDIIGTGSTLKRAADSLRLQGAKEIYCAATHGLFLGDAFEVLQKAGSGILYTDTVFRRGALPVVDAVLADRVLPDYFNL